MEEQNDSRTSVCLPHKLSDLAQLALDDVRAMENTPGYVVSMGDWHVKRGSECAVCAAGAVMARRLGLSREIGVLDPEYFARDFGKHNGSALLAIDSLRMGCVQEALDCLSNGSEAWFSGFYTDDHELSREMADYEINPALWHADMTKLIADLREAGL